MWGWLDFIVVAVIVLSLPPVSYPLCLGWWLGFQKLFSFSMSLYHWHLSFPVACVFHRVSLHAASPTVVNYSYLSLGACWLCGREHGAVLSYSRLASVLGKPYDPRSQDWGSLRDPVPPQVAGVLWWSGPRVLSWLSCRVGLFVSFSPATVGNLPVLFCWPSLSGLVLLSLKG